MNIYKIITKTKLQQQEMEFVVEQYIKEKKGVNVQINLAKRVETLPNFYVGLHLQQQLQLLDKAFNDACIYFSHKQFMES